MTEQQTHMTLADHHAVFATLEDGSKHRVSDWTDWHAATDRWLAMDDQRREALLAKGVVAYKAQQIRHYEVRSAQDPHYTGLPELELERGFRVLTRLYTTETAAAKAVLEPLGYYGAGGGWVYPSPRQRPVSQGWWQAAAATGHHVTRLLGEDGYRGTITSSLQVRVQRGVTS